MDPPSEEWATALLGFSWLRHLRAAESAITRANARALVDEWITLQGSWHPLAWRPDVLSRRVISWLSQSTLLLQDADVRFYRRFLRSLLRQVRYLRHTAGDASRGVARLQAMVALTYAALCIASQGSRIKSATERLNQEITKIMGAARPSVAFRMLSDVGLLAVICPELEECKKTPQDKVAAQDVFEHSLATVDATPENDLVLRLAGLFHDIGKPETFADGHFHQHEFVGEFKARQILRRWKFDQSRLPPGSVVLFRQPTTWEQYRCDDPDWEIVLDIDALVVAFSMIVLHVFGHRTAQRRHACRRAAGRSCLHVGRHGSE